MNRDVLESQWVQIREILKDKFSNLSDEDIRQINGRYDQLVAKLQQKYGYTREEAEERIRSWNFDRYNTTTPRSQYTREDTTVRDRDSSFLKWLLALGIPLLLLGSYFLMNRTPDTTRTPAATQEQFIVETPADRAITNGLRSAFLAQQQQSDAFDFQNVIVTTRNGVVTLSGTVPNAETRNAIVRTAENYTGVRQVINNITVR